MIATTICGPALDRETVWALCIFGAIAMICLMTIVVVAIRWVNHD